MSYCPPRLYCSSQDLINSELSIRPLWALEDQIKVQSLHCSRLKASRANNICGHSHTLNSHIDDISKNSTDDQKPCDDPPYIQTYQHLMDYPTDPVDNSHSVDTKATYFDPRLIPLEIWIKIVVLVATNFEVDNENPNSLSHSPNSLSVSTHSMPFSVTTLQPVPIIDKMESKAENNDPVVALGLTCTYLKEIFNHYCLFFKPSRFAGKNLARCSMRLITALERLKYTFLDNRPQILNKSTINHGGLKGVGEKSRNSVISESSFSIDESSRLIQFHKMLFTQCVSSISKCDWNRLMIYEEPCLDIRLDLTKSIFMQINQQNLKKRVKVARQMQILASLASFLLSTTDEVLQNKVFQIHSQLKQHSTNQCELDTCSQMISPSFDQIFEYLLEQIRLHIHNSSLRTNQISTQTLTAIRFQVGILRKVAYQFISRILMLDPCKRLLWRYFHPSGSLMQIDDDERQSVSFEETRRFEIVLHVIGLCFERPLSELDAIWSTNIYPIINNIFFELRLISYIAPHLIIDSSLCHFLNHVSVHTIIFMEQQRTQETRIRSRKSLRKCLLTTCSRRYRAKSSLDSVSYSSMDTIINIITLSYIFQLSQPLEKMMALGMLNYRRWSFWGISKRLTISLQSANIARPRNWALGNLLYDVCKCLIKGDLEKYQSHSHPFLAPAIYYRWTRRLDQVGLNPTCILSCFGVSQSDSTLPSIFHLILKPVTWSSIQSYWPMKNVEVNVVKQIISRISVNQIIILYHHVGNLELLLMSINSIESTSSPSKKQNTLNSMDSETLAIKQEIILQEIIAALPIVPTYSISNHVEFCLSTQEDQYELQDGTIRTQHHLSVIRVWVMIFQELIRRTSKDKWNHHDGKYGYPKYLNDSKKSSLLSSARGISSTIPDYDIFANMDGDLNGNVQKYHLISYFDLYYHMIKRIIDWKPFFDLEKKVQQHWNHLINEGIVRMVYHKQDALICLIHSVCKLGCFSLANPLFSEVIRMLELHSVDAYAPTDTTSKVNLALLQISKQIFNFFLECPSASIALWMHILDRYSLLVVPALVHQNNKWIRSEKIFQLENRLDDKAPLGPHQNQPIVDQEAWKLLRFRTKAIKRYQQAIQSERKIFHALLNHSIAQLIPRELMNNVTNFRQELMGKRSS